MNTLVIGGTGTVGSLVVGKLLESGASQVGVVTRDEAKAADLPKGAVARHGDLKDPYSMRPLFRGVESVFMLNGAGTSETYEGVMAILLARMEGVKRFVYMSTHKADLTAFLPIGGATKLPIEKALSVSGMSYTILRPNNFYQNDIWYKDSMINEGIYPQPLGFVGMSRVDARDIAAAAVLALTQGGHEGKTYNIVGPQAETGPSCAEKWGRALKRKIVYGGNDMDLFERTHAFMGPSLVFPYRQFYEFYQQHGLCASPEDIEAVSQLLGRPPRSLDEFAQEMAASWL
ncbi:SDR family oxidoreductase [Paraburkholderia sp. RL18-085-BIA-A]|uniref:SDR family oxidoreductase n=1 Tax=Paraburkholderia sp. RL18-085-BIA-A TaxID=3031633 RepID=UPI0038B97B61